MFLSQMFLFIVLNKKKTCAFKKDFRFVRNWEFREFFGIEISDFLAKIPWDLKSPGLGFFSWYWIFHEKASSGLNHSSNCSKNFTLLAIVLVIHWALIDRLNLDEKSKTIFSLLDLPLSSPCQIKMYSFFKVFILTPW